MELKLVYRFLRLVSDWVVDGYYADVLVEGAENVPATGPIIIASTHQNEMIDIATLAAKLPHRRHLSFWAKASMFKHPITGAIMTSSGAIPVRRNPNNLGEKKDNTTSKLSSHEESAARANLFRETTNVLKGDGVIGIFPEGTSCTGWRVFQTMPGASWAALEYTLSVLGEKDAARVRIVPVAVTYTDKTKYQSRIHVRYGAPIYLDPFLPELLDDNTDDNVAAKSAVTRITAEIESRLVELTVNANDWETICAVKTAMELLWTDRDNVSLSDWVDINQRLAALLDDSGASPTKQALCKYNALLHYSGIQHSALSSLIPIPTSAAIVATSTRSLLLRLPLAILQFSAFLPPLLFMLPGYFTGPLVLKVFGTLNEDEGHSQFKAIGGGLGLGPNILLLFSLLWKLRDSGLYSSPWFGSKLGRFVQILGATYLSTSLLIAWHNLLVKANYKNFRQLQTYWKLVRSASSGFKRLDSLALEPYIKPPHPVINPFIKSKYLTNLPITPPTPPRISATKLVPDLFEARRGAGLALSTYLRMPQNEELRSVLEKKGAKLPSY